MYRRPEKTNLNTLPLWRALLRPILMIPALMITLALPGAVKAENALEKIEQTLIADHDIQQISNRVVLDDLTA
ncbi:MAG: hypothetical protein HQ497_09455, partial [SAR86 cluster bacterium]|nr:hypothetical protein [SAR86 cluster bacterium]